MENENVFYVYFHLKEDTGEIFYVGKGKNKRAFSRHGRNDYWSNIVNKHGLKVVIITESLTNKEACELEKHYIKEFGRLDSGGILVNMTDGGDGVIGSVPWNKGIKMPDNWNVGRVLSQETKDKISKSNKGRKQGPAWNKGISPTVDTLEKMREKIPWNKGLKHSEETKKKISESAKNRKPRKGFKHTEETKRKISETKKNAGRLEEIKEYCEMDVSSSIDAGNIIYG